MIHRFCSISTILLSVLVISGCGGEATLPEASNTDSATHNLEVSAEVSRFPNDIDRRERSADEDWDKALYFGMAAANLAQTADTSEHWNFVHTVW